MSLEQLYIAYNIDIAPEGHKHNRDGWINTECPHCSGSGGYHLGFNIDGGYYSCYHCGGHNLGKTLSKLLKVPYHRAIVIAKEYNVKSTSRRRLEASSPKVNINPFRFPTKTKELTAVHRKYLEGRRFDPDYLIEDFEIKGSSVFSKLEGIDYGRRIIAPIYWNDEIVSFQGRDYTDKHPIKYLACPKKREVMEHQTILYGKGIVTEAPPKRVIVVEGITDVWRFGEYAVSTFGIAYTPEQVRWISKLYEEVVVIYDPEPQAQSQAKKLIADLRFRGVKAQNIKLGSDPGELSQKKANRLLHTLGF
jgi:DNA primase